jgi:hypothetical protein
MRQIAGQKDSPLLPSCNIDLKFLFPRTKFQTEINGIFYNSLTFLG